MSWSEIPDDLYDAVPPDERDAHVARVLGEFEEAPTIEREAESLHRRHALVITEEQARLLAKRIPDAAYVERQDEDGLVRFVPAYVIDHIALSIFGDQLSSKVVANEIVFDGRANQLRGRGRTEGTYFQVIARATVRVWVTGPKGHVWRHEASAVSSGRVPHDLGDNAAAFRQAIVGAETIARKKALSFFGRALGFYERDQDGLIARVRNAQQLRFRRIEAKPAETAPAAENERSPEDLPTTRARVTRVAARKGRKPQEVAPPASEARPLLAETIDVFDDTGASVHPARGLQGFAEYFGDLVDRARTPEALAALQRHNKAALDRIAGDPANEAIREMLATRIEEREIYFKGREGLKAEAEPREPAAETVAGNATREASPTDAKPETEAKEPARRRRSRRSAAPSAGVPEPPAAGAEPQASQDAPAEEAPIAPADPSDEAAEAPEKSASASEVSDDPQNAETPAAEPAPAEASQADTDAKAMSEAEAEPANTATAPSETAESPDDAASRAAEMPSEAPEPATAVGDAEPARSDPETERRQAEDPSAGAASAAEDEARSEPAETTKAEASPEASPESPADAAPKDFSDVPQLPVTRDPNGKIVNVHLFGQGLVAAIEAAADETRLDRIEAAYGGIVAELLPVTQRYIAQKVAERRTQLRAAAAEATEHV